MVGEMATPCEKLVAKCTGEAVGTFVLIVSVGLAFFEGGIFVPFLVAAALETGFSMTAFVSGCQFNPAISIGVIIVKAFSGKAKQSEFLELSLFMVIQMIFGVLGGAMAYAISGHTYHFKISSDYHQGQAFLGELLFTAMLVGSALTIGKTPDSKLVGGSAVSAVIISAAYAIAPISGCSINPAGVVGISLIDVIRTGASFDDWWIYILAQVFGAIVAALIFIFVKRELTPETSEEGDETYVKVKS